MRILILYRHFWPDSPPYASMLRSLGRELVRAGHDVTIWTEQPCYKASDLKLSAPARETLDGIAVERFARLPGSGNGSSGGLVRLADKLAFIPRLLAKALVRKLGGAHYDLVWTASIPPVAQGLAGRMIARLFKARFLYHCQDLYPEIAGHMGMVRQGGPLYRLMAGIEAKTRRLADPLVTLSGDMGATVNALVHPRRLAIINNFMLEEFGADATRVDTPAEPDHAAWSHVRTGDVRIVFAGNLGQFQGLEAAVEAMRLLAAEDAPVHLLFLGEGKALAGLKAAAAGLANVSFAAHRPFGAASRVIAAADAGLVSLEPEIHRFAFPSKTMTYLGLGVPVALVTERDSELARLIVDNRLGWAAAGRDPAEIAASFRAIAASHPQFAGLRTHVDGWYRGNWSHAAVFGEWVRLIASPAKATGNRVD